jgi:vanillate O-demethylase ferredoxin subunit
MPGARVRISPPRNNFRLVETARNSILIAGGIGITPLLGMAWRLAELNLNFHLHYCTRSLARTAFRPLLRQYPSAGRHTLHLDDETSNGRFDVLRVLADPHMDTHVYVCGPGGFMTYVTDVAERVGWSAENVHLEHFAPRAEPGGSEFRVRAAKSAIEVTVSAGRTIAQVLIENGVDVPLSCESGVCGTCLTRVLEGIPEHCDLFQTDDEKRSNRQMTLCCSRAVTPLLVLDI